MFSNHLKVQQADENTSCKKHTHAKPAAHVKPHHFFTLSYTNLSYFAKIPNCGREGGHTLR